VLFISIQELETAINYWRERQPSFGDELVLCPQAAALAKPYALMIVQSSQRIPLEALGEKARNAWDEYLINVKRGTK
jgi:hypothetical protein